MLLTPHLVARRLKVEGKSDREVLGTGYGAATLMWVQLTPVEPGTAYEKWGVALDRPYFLLHTGEVSETPVGALLGDQDGRYWEVVTVASYDFGNASDHVSGVAKLLQFDPATVDPAFHESALQHGAGRFPDPAPPGAP